MPVLTLSMIVKNEEKYLRDCLESVKDVVDDIVIVDTGSTDRTIDIAKEYNAKIYHFNWINDFSAARNYALSKSTGRWILYLDADERLSRKSVPELKSIIRSNSKEGYFCLVMSTDRTAPNDMKYTRLFRNSRNISFTGTIHEQIIYSLEKEHYKIRNSNIEIIHVGYDISRDQLKVKAKRNIEYLLQEYKPGKSIYDDFQIAQTYAILEEHENAVKYFKNVLEYGACPPFYKAHAHRYIASCELSANNMGLALEHIEKGFRYDKEQPLLNMVASKVYMRLMNYDMALLYCKKAYEYNKDHKIKQFEIYINDKVLIFLGLQEATLANNQEYFNYFYENLVISDSFEANNNKLILMVKALFNNEPVNEDDIKSYTAIINNTNFEFLLTLIERYQDKELRLILLKNVPEFIKSKPVYLNILGQVYMETGRLEEAEKIFCSSVSIDLIDPSVVFYLVSIYVKLNKFEKIPALIKLAENKFLNFPEVKMRIDILKQKVSPFLPN